MACGFVLRQCVIGTYIGSGYPFVLWVSIDVTTIKFHGNPSAGSRAGTLRKAGHEAKTSFSRLRRRAKIKLSQLIARILRT